MSPVNLLQPLLDGGVQRNNFFNGRILSAEDLRAEQDANRLQRGQVVAALGDGVAWGLDVTVASAAAFTVTVRRGLALNRHRDLLSLGEDIQVTLTAAPPSVGASDTGVFAQCEPPRTSAAFTDASVHVLVAAPASGYQGSALVSDPNTTAIGRGACGARFSVEGIRFRLVPVPLSRLSNVDIALAARIADLLPPPDVASRERLRNLLAHLCFGTYEMGAFFIDPLGPAGEATTWAGWGAVDELRYLRELTDCDVPLALVVLTRAGISFVDTWSVRRGLGDAGAITSWRGAATPRRMAEAEAAFLQFQSQLEIVRALGGASSMTASTYFDVLPPAGWLPIGSGGFNWTTFLGTHAPRAVTQVDAALLRGIVQRSWRTDPFALATTPPVPLRVYQVPDASFVLFARTDDGAVRVTLAPTPSAGETVEVLLTPVTGSPVRGSGFVAGRLTVPDVEPGRHAVTIASPDYQQIPTTTVDVVGGRTTDISIALTPLPNGRIVLSLREEDTDDAIDASLVVSVTATGGGQTYAAARVSGAWEFANLPDATFTVTGAAQGYRTATLGSVGPTRRGTVTTRTLYLEAAEKDEPPPECMLVKEGSHKLLATEMVLCLVTSATEFDEGYFNERKKSLTGTIAGERYTITSRKRGKRERGDRQVTSAGEITYRDGAPWEKMEKLTPLPDAVERWLRDWAAWLAEEVSVDTLRDMSPYIAVDAGYRIPRTAAQVPALPPAYAVFGRLAIPLMIRPKHGRTPLPVRLDRQVLPWVDDGTFRALERAGIRHLNDLAWAWAELVVDATGDPPHTAPQLIADAIEAVERVNATRGYYPGMTTKTDGALKTAGYPTDHALANASAERLERAVGSRGFAVRLIHEARTIVPRSSWDVDELPLSSSQKEALRVRGVDSQGELVERSTDPAGKAVIADALGFAGLTASRRDELIEPVVNEAVTGLARDAVVLAPKIPLALWSGVNATTAAVLEESGFGTVDDLARADEAAVAAAGNLSTADAQALVANAQKESLAQAHVDAVLGLAAGTNTRLTSTFGGQKATLGGILAKSATDLTGAFGGESRAGSVLKGLKQGFDARGPR